MHQAQTTAGSLMLVAFPRVRPDLAGVGALAGDGSIVECAWGDPHVGMPQRRTRERLGVAPAEALGGARVGPGCVACPRQERTRLPP